MKPTILFASAFVASILTPSASVAQSPSDIARIEVLPGWEMADGRQMAALKISLSPGWKTYWRAPGDAGIPPSFDWARSQNVTAVALHWPTPEVFDQNGMQTLGYHDSVVIPIEVGMANGGAILSGTVEMGVCEEICVPVTLSFTGDLTPAAARDPEIVAALVDQPLPGADVGAGQAICRAEPTADGFQVTWSVDLPPQGGTEVVVIEAGQSGIWTSESEVVRQGKRLTAQADMVVVSGAAVFDRAALRATVIGAHGAVDLQGCVGG